MPEVHPAASGRCGKAKEAVTACNRCASTSVSWGKTKAGKAMLMEASVPHFVVCKAQKNGKAKRSKEDTEMKEMLTGQFGKQRAKELLPYAKGDDLETRYLAVLAHVNAEGG